MSKTKELQILAVMAGVFAGFYFLPLDAPRFERGLQEALALSQWYAREHVILCLLPAFWIAGAIGAFVSQQSVMRYFGPNAAKTTSYGVASVSGRTTWRSYSVLLLQACVTRRWVSATMGGNHGKDIHDRTGRRFLGTAGAGPTPQDLASYPTARPAYS